MERKSCSRCHQVKPLNEFPLDKRAKTGRASRCNSCMSEVLAAYRATTKGQEARKATQHRYAESPKGSAKRAEYARTDAAKEQRKRYVSTEKGQEIMRASRAKYAARAKQTRIGRLQVQAKMAVRHAVDAGRLPPVTTQMCSGCGDKATHYHHYLDYEPSHWLNVIPLCKSCHDHAHGR